ncbi:MAG: L-threonylcarbamoyladenylate synthase [Clostridium sp.]|nr:L-threonylcarbamoyladenylate synthase [Clostridium sp.]MCM1547023.1 L-threonylcarbamoyladenylate synthase [Ruminococcus sp.]
MENTILLSADNDDDIKYAAQLLKKGQVVGIPTETVYGLGADALNPEAVKAVFAAKGRPADNPLIVHISDIAAVTDIAHDVPKLFYSLAKSFWPGPLTMIAPKNDIIPYETSGGLETVGIRMPSHPLMRKLISMSGPVAAPSANTSGYPSPTEAKHVMHDMNGKIPAIIDGGKCGFGVESTVISFDSETTVRILRPGSITPEMLGKTVENVIIDDAIINDVKDGEKAMSPGMKYKHYSPKANIMIIEGDFEKFYRYVEGKTGHDIYCLVPDSDNDADIPINCLSYGRSSEQQAQQLFSKLRQLDELGAKTVYVRPPKKTGVGLAVYNRLIRAAGFEVIRL